MAERYPSRIALLLERAVDDPGPVLAAARAAGDLDRTASAGGGQQPVHQVFWAGRRQGAAVRAVRDDDGAKLLRTEAVIDADGLTTGMQRHARLLQALLRQLPDQVTGVRDESARRDHPLAWVHQLTAGAAEAEDAIAIEVDGEGTRWVYTHGAARFGVPDLELYGLSRAQAAAAPAVLRGVHGQLLAGGLTTELSLPDGTPVYLLPVREAWQKVPLDWPGIGRAGRERGPGLDGPRATLSVLHRPRFGRYRRDLEGVLAALGRA